MFNGFSFHLFCCKKHVPLKSDNSWSNECLLHYSSRFYSSQRIHLEVRVAATYNLPSICSKADVEHRDGFSIFLHPSTTHGPNFYLPLTAIFRNSFLMRVPGQSFTFWLSRWSLNCVFVDRFEWELFFSGWGPSRLSKVMFSLARRANFACIWHSPIWEGVRAWFFPKGLYA